MSLIGREIEDTGERKTQVYLATHDGEGNRLPLMNRSFISFTYDGVSIEDYNFIATIENNSLNRPFYGEFENNTSLYEVLDGQFYWGSHFTKNTLEFILATDGITEERLAQFKRLFSPGPAKELILSENPNRGIQARIAQLPSYDNLLPFEKQVTKKIMGQEYKTKTTYYKGFINITFEADDPFWYSIKNIIGVNSLDANRQSVNSLLDQDTLKVIVEDNIPYYGMLEQEIMVGDGTYSKDIPNGYKDGVGIAPEQETAYLYYAGTAPGQTIMSFSLTPNIDSTIPYVEPENYQEARIGEALIDIHNIYLVRAVNTETGEEETFYIQEPGNLIYKNNINNDREDFSYIKVGNTIFKFTTPGIYTGYNQAIQIFSSLSGNEAITEVKTLVREGIKEYYSRAWAMGILNIISKTPFCNNGCLQNYEGVESKYALNKMMWCFLLNRQGKLPDAKFTFNSKTGEAIGEFRVRTMPKNTALPTNVEGSILDLFAQYVGDITLIKENVGDMVYDKYLLLEDRNFPNDEGKITSNECSEITTDFSSGINNLKIEYKHLYL